MNNVFTKLASCFSTTKQGKSPDDYEKAIKKAVASAKKEVKKADKAIRVTERKYYKLLTVALRIKEQMRSLHYSDDRIEDIERLILRLQAIKYLDNREELSDINNELIKLEDDNIRHSIKSLYIKTIIPGVYNRYKDEPIEDKVLFLQPRGGLNPSCRYLYNKLKKEKSSKLKLFELHRNHVTLTEEYINLVEFIKQMATVRAVVLHEFNEYFGYITIRPETKMIQLWHGCGIIKGLGMSTVDYEGAEFKTAAEYEEYPEFDQYDLVTIPSEAERWIFQDFMGKKEFAPEIKAIGVSRTDEFFDDSFIDNCKGKLHELIPASENKKVILYAPTFRGLDPDRYAPNELNIAMFSKALSDNYVLIIKHHQTAKVIPPIPEQYRDSFAFDMSRSKEMNINELLACADICITDYSSVVFEYSLFERPVILFMFDKDRYRDSRGMYYSYEELAQCGTICETNEEVINCIAEIDKSGFDQSKIKAFKNKYMNACDGHSTDRIIDFIYDD